MANHPISGVALKAQNPITSAPDAHHNIWPPQVHKIESAFVLKLFFFC
jgi:hypothetical protein